VYKYVLAALVLLGSFAGCGRESNTPGHEPEKNAARVAKPTPGPVPLENARGMTAFLTSGRFDAVGTQDRGDTWWHFRNDGSFEAQQAAIRLKGRWKASMTELHLSKLSVSTEGKPASVAPDQTRRLEWQDGKLNINIDGRQYRLYGRK
jgi:hypothetical protein